MLKEFWPTAVKGNKPQVYRSNLLEEISFSGSGEEILKSINGQKAKFFVTTNDDVLQLTTSEIEMQVDKLRKLKSDFSIRDFKNSSSGISKACKKLFMQNDLVISAHWSELYKQNEQVKFKIELNHQLICPINNSLKIIIPKTNGEYIYDYTKSSQKLRDINLGSSQFENELIELKKGESCFLPFGLIYRLSFKDDLQLLSFKQSEMVLSEVIEFLRENIFKTADSSNIDVYKRLDQEQSKDLVKNLSYNKQKVTNELAAFYQRKKLIKYKYGIK